MIIDEVSMVACKRLQMMKCLVVLSILAVGDLYQLPPVGQAPLFSTVSDCYGSGSLWVDHFVMLELTEVMRQRGDIAFSELLCRVRTNSCTSDDVRTLKSREIAANAADPYLENWKTLELTATLDALTSLCFCEPWLNASQLSPVLLDDQINIRCDRSRVTCENKGGLLMCVPSRMNPSNIQRFTANSIEAVSATIHVPNVSSIQMGVVYRSPSVPQTTLTTVDSLVSCLIALWVTFRLP